MVASLKYLLTTMTTILPLLMQSQATLPMVEGGRIERIDSFVSKYVTPRHIDVWLPDGYAEAAPCAVLYMHDGQMLFDSTMTWNNQAWEVDAVATSLMRTGDVRDFIVVGIWNDPERRHSDYFPQKPFEALSQAEKDTVTAQLMQHGRISDAFLPQADNYLKFLVQELKPLITEKYAVLQDAQNTCIAGSSMGGLISMYAICEYPDEFGGAACLSTHWPGTFTLENNAVPQSFLDYLSDHLPDPANHRLYFDYGDQTLDALYPHSQHQVDSIMTTQGYDEDHWETLYFPGHDHSERSWRKRLAFPLTFLFKK